MFVYWFHVAFMLTYINTYILCIFSQCELSIIFWLAVNFPTVNDVNK